MKYYHNHFLILLITILALPLYGMESPLGSRSAIAALSERVEQNQSQNMELFAGFMQQRDADQEKALAREQALQNQILVLNCKLQKDIKVESQLPSVIGTIVDGSIVHLGLEAIAPGSTMAKLVAFQIIKRRLGAWIENYQPTFDGPQLDKKGRYPCGQYSHDIDEYCEVCYPTAKIEWD